MMKLTTSRSILIGFALIALSIASIPYSNLIVPKAYADDDETVAGKGAEVRASSQAKEGVVDSLARKRMHSCL